MSSGLAVIIGVGPGLGASLARKFAAKYTVALFARNPAYLDTLKTEIEQSGGKASSFPCDVTSEESVKSAFAAVTTQYGDTPVEVAVYNASGFARGSIIDMETSEFENAWKAGCLGGFLVSKQILPGMVARNRGSLIFTGATASLRGGAKFAGFAVGKFGLRALAQSLAREFGPQGVHVAHVIVDGGIDSERVRGMWNGNGRDPEKELMNPDHIAEAYVYLHEQHPSVWTHELDVRTSLEKF